MPHKCIDSTNHDKVVIFGGGAAAAFASKQ
jgi:hypothetical protein